MERTCKVAGGRELHMCADALTPTIASCYSKQYMVFVEFENEMLK